MALNCEILLFGENLNEQKSKFFDGETVKGTVNLHLTENMTVKKLDLRINGEARCSWVDSGNNNHYSGKETYVDHSIPLIQIPTEFQSGNYRFSFTIQLPSGIPSSVEEDKGFIRYSVNVIIKRSKLSDLKISKEFQVIRKLDLNTSYPENRRPVSDSRNMNRKYMCCYPRDSWEANVTISASGLIPDEIVSVNVGFMYLRSPSLISCVYVNLAKRIIYCSSSLGGKTKEKTIIVKSESIHASEHIVQGLISYHTNFKIPQICASTESSCRVIKISYEFQIGVSISGSISRTILKIPVIIGTVPYVTSKNNRESCETPPPSYEEVCFD